MKKLVRLIIRIKKGDWEAFYDLGDIYLFGLGRNEISSQKAIELYEYGVIKKDIKSIRKLGDIWFNGTDDIEKDRIKAKYFYSLGVQLGDKYCKDMLEW
jgi:TPR repeat protein